MQRILMICFCLSLIGCQTKKEDKPVLETKEQKYSYHVGVQLGYQLLELKFRLADLDPDLIAYGLKDILERRELLISEREMKKAKLFVEEEMMEKVAKARMKRDPEYEARAKKNQKASEAFLEENRKKEGVQVAESGLQYEIIEQGAGKSPGPKDEVLINFRGTLIDGAEFDRSGTTDGGPAKFRVQHLIEGFAEALEMMQEGAKWKIYVPSKLAYGLGGRKPHIGPNAALIFEVELLEVIPNQYEYDPSKYKR